MPAPAHAAEHVLEEYWDGNLPIEPAALARKVGIVIEPVTGANYSGRACYREGTPIIEYNNADSLLRQRFAIAHEFGHHLLHKPDKNHEYRDDPSKFSLNVSSPKETEANKFAAELLMPELVVKHFIFNKNIRGCCRFTWVTK